VLTLPPFEYHAPGTVTEAVALLAAHRGNVKVIAGGTDLVPNMKHRLFTPGHVVGLRGIRGLDLIKEEAGFIALGAMTTIAELARHPLVLRRLPSLASAAAQIAGPQLREMGTLGGNLCLDTRCVYYNQTYFRRQALGFCLKKDGTVCHVVKSGKKCVAAASNDTAPVLLTLGATVSVAGPRGIRELALSELYVPDGIVNMRLGADELLTEVRVPSPSPRLRAGYQKVRVRASIDYPALTVALAFETDASERLEKLSLVLSALGARPHSVGGLDALRGRPVDAALVSEVGRMAHKQCHPLTNINVDTGWRRQMIPVFVRRAFEQAQPPHSVI
jgi:4-hydroxybenzoyl-CoA reductase subunit beta